MTWDEWHVALRILVNCHDDRFCQVYTLGKNVPEKG